MCPSTGTPDPVSSSTCPAVFQDREALPLVTMAATSWLQSAMTALAPGRRGLQIDDEVWALLANEWTVRHLQARLKLCRHPGGSATSSSATDSPTFEPSPPTAAPPTNWQRAWLGDTGTRIFFQQAPDQVADAKELLGLTDTEAGYLPKLVRGRALWRVGEHRRRSCITWCLRERTSATPIKRWLHEAPGPIRHNASPAPTCAHCSTSCRPGHRTRSNRAWRCPSIDHDDVHPSVTVRIDRRGIERWKCWSGGQLRHVDRRHTRRLPHRVQRGL